MTLQWLICSNPHSVAIEFPSNLCLKRICPQGSQEAMAFGKRGGDGEKNKTFFPKIERGEKEQTLKVMKCERVVSLSHFKRVQWKAEQQDIKLQGESDVLLAQESIWFVRVVLAERKDVAHINKEKEGCRPQEKAAGGDF